MNTTHNSFSDDSLVNTIHYRNFSIPVYLSNHSNYYYTVIAGLNYIIGRSNYEAQIKCLIDRQLDLIKYLDTHSWIQWFENGDHRDIKLVHNNRTLKIFLVQDQDEVNMQKLIKEAMQVLHTYQRIAQKKR